MEMRSGSYLYIWDPEQTYVEDTVSDEASQVESQEVKVETYNTENKHLSTICASVSTCL